MTFARHSFEKLEFLLLFLNISLLAPFHFRHRSYSLTGKAGSWIRINKKRLAFCVNNSFDWPHLGLHNISIWRCMPQFSGKFLLWYILTNCIMLLRRRFKYVPLYFQAICKINFRFYRSDENLMQWHKRIPIPKTSARSDELTEITNMVIQHWTLNNAGETPTTGK